MLVLSDGDVQRLLPIGDCVVIADRAYRDLAHARALSPPRMNLAVPYGEGCERALKVWTAVDPSASVAAVRMTASAIEMMRYADRVIGESIPAASDGMFVGLVVLFDLATTEPVAIIHDARLSQLSVSLPAALSVKYLAGADAAVVGLLGAGMQARQQLEAIAATRAISEVRVFTPRRRDADAFARDIEAALQLKVRAVDDRRDAVADCDIVVTASSAPAAIFEAAWIRPGTHVSLTRPSEAPSDLAAVASRFFTAGYEKPLTYSIADAGALWRARSDRCDSVLADIVALPDVIAGLAPGRTAPDEITVYGAFAGYSPGLLFASLGKQALDRAARDKVGHTLPTALFLQERAS
jgi:ornithine cyclodeaminase/alanine dehydrogenase-like protein (mu-crystallin family)